VVAPADRTQAWGARADRAARAVVVVQPGMAGQATAEVEETAVAVELQAQRAVEASLAREGGQVAAPADC
jgi:hypothetical protein